MIVTLQIVPYLQRESASQLQTKDYVKKMLLLHNEGSETAELHGQCSCSWNYQFIMCR